MRKALFSFLGALFVCTQAAGQPGKQTFEVADVHVSAPGTTESVAFLVGARVELRANTVIRLIALAYTLPEDQIDGVPAWVDDVKFDLTAKGPAGTAEIGLRNMLQNLLEERFGLKVEQGDKPRPVFALVLAKPGLVKESKSSGDPGCHATSEEGYRMIRCQKMSMADLGGTLRQMAAGYFNLPVVDRTGLTGKYDVNLRFLGRGQLPPGPEGASSSLFNVLEKELGIKVEKQSAPTPVLTIVHVNREPTPNNPDVTEKLGATPTEFDVADVRPSAPDTKEDFKLNNGRLEAKAVPLKDLIGFAFGTGDGFDEDRIRGEKWIDSARFDIVAKTAPTESPDTLRVMLKNLMTQRFDIKVHTEKQPVSVFALTAAKPKLKAADPSRRSLCKMSIVDGARVIGCQNTTMAQLAERLRNFAGGYLDHEAVDLTGLTAAYDFEITFMPFGNLARRMQQKSGEGAPAEIEAPSGMTLFEAVDRQLGIKLAAAKHPMPVVVIDHCNKTPSEN